MAGQAPLRSRWSSDAAAELGRWAFGIDETYLHKMRALQHL
jgi:hypothetical protein